MRGLRPVSCWCGTAAARASLRGQLVPIQQPVTRANGMADGCRRIGGRTVTLADGVRMAGMVSLLTGSGVPAAAPSIIPSLIGAVRQAGGVIRSRASAWVPWGRANVLRTADSSLSMRASTRDSALSQRDERFLEVWDEQRADCRHRRLHAARLRAAFFATS